MRDLKSHLVEAVRNWCTEAGLTVHLLVRVDADTEVPAAYVQHGQIVLNLSASAVSHFELVDQWLHMEARFSGVSHAIRIPMAAIVAIYPLEQPEQGLSFHVEPRADDAASDPAPSAPSKPQFRLWRDDE